jgi:inosose dehydratase
MEQEKQAAGHGVPGFKFGSEVYTWFMKEDGRAYANRLDHMIEVIAKAGFTGVQPIFGWMGDLAAPNRLADCLRKNGIHLAALSLVLDWNGPEETPEEQRTADAAIDLLVHFAGAILCVVQKPTDRNNLMERRRFLLQNLHSVARRAVRRGIACSFHPNSPHSSITRTREDYEVLLSGLDRNLIGWTPDVGHIINAGMDPLQTMKEYAELINHVHFKDWDGKPEFVLMGKGVVDFRGVVRFLNDRRYAGWIICEDEGAAALDDPDGVTLHDGSWIRNSLLNSI